MERLHNAAAGARVRLHHVDRPRLEEPPEAIARIKPLSGGQRNIDFIPDGPVRVHVERVHGFLVPEDVVGLDGLAEPPHHIRRTLRRHVHKQLALRTDGLANELHGPDRAVENLLRHFPVLDMLVQMADGVNLAHRIHFHGRKALLGHCRRALGKVLRANALALRPSVCVNRNNLALLAS